MNEYQRRILSSIAQNPRRLHDIPDAAKRQIHPDVIAKYIEEMKERGYIFEDNGAFHITVLGRQFMDVKTDVATPRTMAGLGIYKPAQQHYRPGSQDFLKCKSKGMI